MTRSEAITATIILAFALVMSVGLYFADSGPALRVKIVPCERCQQDE